MDRKSIEQMINRRFSGKVKELIDYAQHGEPQDIDYIINHLTSNVSISMTKFVDHALSCVDSETGINRIEYYLYNGTPIQRNYCSLFFNRRGDWKVVKKAFDAGRIDEIQAFAR